MAARERLDGERGTGMTERAFALATLKIGDHVTAEIERIGRIEIEIAPPG